MKWFDIKENPPDNDRFFNAYWVWDGEFVILSFWANEKWEVKGFHFDPGNITHYCELIKPDPPKGQ